MKAFTVADALPTLPDLLIGYGFIDAGRGPIPAPGFGPKVEFFTDDVVAWGRVTLYGDNRTWTCARLKDGTEVALLLKDQLPSVQKFARALMKETGAVLASRETGIGSRWTEVAR